MEEQEQVQEQQVQAQVTENLELEVTAQEEYDYTGYSKDQLFDSFKQLSKEADILKREKEVGEITSLYVAFYKEEEKEALNAFTADGTHKSDFEYNQPDNDRVFFELYNALKARFKEARIQKKEQLTANLQKKRSLLEELRLLVDGEVKGENFNKVRTIQTSWKAADPIQSSDRRELFANYNGLMTRFYNNHNILNELRDLDRKKNQEEKEELCIQAEALLEEKIIKTALRKFNDLFEQYKSIGRAPEETNEALWERIKVVSNLLREKRNVSIEEFKVKLEKNYNAKQIVLTHFRSYAEKSSENISEWKQWTDEVKGIQELWRQAGQVMEEKAKAISQEFWSINKAFFEAKGKFFDSLDAQREANLVKKQALLDEVNILKADESISLDDKINKVKNIQARWKDIGQAPRKVNDTIFADFRAICNSFFDERQAQKTAQDESYKGNLVIKQQLINEISELSSVEDFQAKVTSFHEAGFVPMANKRDIEKAFKSSCNEFLAKVKEDLPEKEFFELKYKTEFVLLGDDAGREISKVMAKLRDNISKIDNEVSTLSNNLAFFANSKQLETIKKDVDAQIEVMTKDKEEIKGQIKYLRSLEA